MRAIPARVAVVVLTVLGALVAIPRAAAPVKDGAGQGAHAARQPTATDAPVVGEPVVTRHLRVNLRLAQPAPAPGGQATLIAEIVPAAKMHVYAPGQDN